MSEREVVRYMSTAEYLQFEETSGERHEYIRGAIFTMSGATQAHNLIVTNLTASLHSFLKDGSCRVFSNAMKLHVEAADSIYYPDLLVTCESFDSKAVLVSAPRLIIEVLSPSTASIDCREKYGAYIQLPSLQQYVLVYQNRLRIDVYERDSDGQWDRVILRKDDQLKLHAKPGERLAIALTDVYGGMDEPPQIEEPTAEYFPFDDDPVAARN